MYDHEKEWAATHIERLKQLYQDLLAKYNAVQYAQVEGVVEVSVRSLSQAIAVSIDGNMISQLLIEGLDKRLDELELAIRWHQSQFAEELNESSVLASRAVAAAVPKQKGPGRPRKMQPQPQVMEAVAISAAQVPMNSNNGHAVGRAVNLPQG